jgi:hypothetical protein
LLIRPIYDCARSTTVSTNLRADFEIALIKFIIRWITGDSAFITKRGKRRKIVRMQRDLEAGLYDVYVDWEFRDHPYHQRPYTLYRQLVRQKIAAFSECDKTPKYDPFSSSITCPQLPLCSLTQLSS